MNDLLFARFQMAAFVGVSYHLRRRRDRHAAMAVVPLCLVAAAAQASFILWGWAWSQFAQMLPPDQLITALAAPRITLKLTLG